MSLAARSADEAQYPRVLRGLGSPPCPTAHRTPHLVGVVGTTLHSPSGSHHRGEWTSRQRIDARVASRREWWPGSGSWTPGRNVGRKYAATLKRLGQPTRSDLSMPERVPDLGAVERAHSSIKLCAASLFETCSTGVEVAQNPATKDEIRGRAKSMKRAASRVGPDPR